MDEALVAILVVITALASGFVLGDVSSKYETTTDCQKLGKFRHKGTVYECKEVK